MMTKPETIVDFHGLLQGFFGLFLAQCEISLNVAKSALMSRVPVLPNWAKTGSRSAILLRGVALGKLEAKELKIDCM